MICDRSLCFGCLTLFANTFYTNHTRNADPPKFHYPNNGNPSLTYRNDQLGVNARNIDDIIAFDQAVLGTGEAHEAAKAYVEGLANKDIRIGCSTVYYNYTTATDAIRERYTRVENVLKDAGFTFVGECQTKNPMTEVPNPPDTNPNAVWYEEMTNFMTNGLGLTDLTPWEVLLNGYFDFGTTLNLNTEEAKSQYLGPIPAARSDVYNEYFDANRVDLMMGPSQYCNVVHWTEDIGGSVGANDGCDGGRSTSGCMYACHSAGILGSLDKTFTKAKFVVPVGLTGSGGHFSVQFMSRAGPRDPQVPATEWVYDEEGPKTWNLEELYMVKRIADTLEASGLGRADAPFNEKVTGLNLSADETTSGGGGAAVGGMGGILLTALVCTSAVLVI